DVCSSDLTPEKLEAMAPLMRYAAREAAHGEHTDDPVAFWRRYVEIVGPEAAGHVWFSQCPPEESAGHGRNRAQARSRETAHYTAAGRTGSRKGEGKHVESSTSHASRVGGNTPRLQGNHNDSSLSALRRLGFPVAARPGLRRMHRRGGARMDRTQAKDHAWPRRARNVRGIRGGL